MNKILPFLAAIIVGAINAYRGSGNAKNNPITKILFSKYVTLIYLFGLMYLFQGWWAALYLAPIIFLFATGTGGVLASILSQQQFDKLENKQPSEFIPFDMAVDLLVDEVTTLDDYRDWGVIYSSLVGMIFAIPALFGFTGCLVMLLTGAIMYGLRFVPTFVIFEGTDERWRLIEFGWFGLVYFMGFAL